MLYELVVESETVVDNTATQATGHCHISGLSYVGTSEESRGRALDLARYA
jgi:hypothetical protein